MKNIASFYKRNQAEINFLGMAALAFVAFVAAPGTLLAQLPDATAVTSSLSGTAGPFIKLARILLGVACIVGALFQGFKAAKGATKDWITCIALLIVGAVVLSPGTFFNMLGLTGVCGSLSAWGICG